ncbi:MAG: phosphatidylcholine synthase [Actinomycetaceae bacterium]|nr:phosphatidylcholine synthase [Actinomycetaceae bacterium]
MSEKGLLGKQVAAWAVHAFTMSGLLWAMLAVHALFAHNYKLMWLYLGISLIVDAADGPMSRKCNVCGVIPWFSGTMMDNVIDYITWTFIPCLFMMIVLPLGSGILPAIAAMAALSSSMFCYANTKMKSTDWYFVGFPAAWNVVAVILWLWGTGPVFNWIIIVLFTILAAIPWKWVHPFRVRRLRIFNATAAAIWVITTGIWVGIYPAAPWYLTIPWWVAGLWILAASAIRTIRGVPDMS